MSRTSRSLIAITALVALLAACGDSATTTTAAPASTTTTAAATTTAGGDTTTSAPEVDEWDAVVAAATEVGFVDVDWVTNETDVAALTALWEADYPDIELRSRRDVSGPMAAIEEEEVSAGSAEFDVVMNADPAFVLRWREEGRMADLTGERWYESFPPEFAYETFAQNYLGVFTLVYNTDNVAESEIPTSWEDLLQPHWAGRLGIADPATGAGSTKVATYVLHEALGIEYFEQLADLQPVLYDNVLNGGQALAAGEVDVFIMGSTITVTQLLAEGAPLAIAPVEHSSPVSAFWFIYSGAEQVDGARVFIDWILTDEDPLGYWESTARIVPSKFGPGADFGSVHEAYEGMTADQIDFPVYDEYLAAVADGLMDDIAAILGF